MISGSYLYLRLSLLAELEPKTFNNNNNNNNNNDFISSTSTKCLFAY